MILVLACKYRDTLFPRQVAIIKSDSSRSSKKRHNLDPNDLIVFLDETRILFSSTITRMWSLNGQQPKIYTHDGRKRQPLIGAVDPIGSNLHVSLTDGLKAEQFQHFLEGLLARYPASKKLVIVLDNTRVHHAKQLAPFLERNEDRLELSYLLPYFPDLNPMEWCLKFM